MRSSYITITARLLTILRMLLQAKNFAREEFQSKDTYKVKVWDAFIAKPIPNDPGAPGLLLELHNNF